MPQGKKITKKKTPESSGNEKKNANQSGRVPRRREIGAFLCLIIGIFTFLAYFTASPEDGVLLFGLREGISGLIGWGFFAVPPMLFVAMVILFFHRGRPVILRLVCVSLIPIVIGAIMHLFFYTRPLAFAPGTVGDLWETGREMESGGIFSGILAQFLESMVSIVGAVIVFVIVLLGCILFICNKSVADIADWLKNRKPLEYEYEPEPEPAWEFPKEKKRRLPLIDIPVDGEDSVASGGKSKSKKPIALKRPNVASPDRFLTEDVTLPPSAFTKEYDIPFGGEKLPERDDSPDVPNLTDYQPDSAPPIRDQVIASDPVPTVEKIRPQDVAEARADIAKTIEETQTEPLPEYKFPSIDLLKKGKATAVDGSKEVALNAERLGAALTSFGIDANIVSVTRGPSVTRYELELEAGIKLNKLTNLADDLALSLGASGVRIAPIPDKISTVGIEVPNKLVSTVYLREVIESKAFTAPADKLTFALGKDISGTCMVGNIAKLPHLLIAGTTGSGKSVTMNSLILSVLYKAQPDEVKFIMIDPKMVEFGIYNGIPHLLIPVVTDPKKAAGALQWAVTEMLKRYKLFSETGARDLAGYNNMAKKREELQPFPQLVVVIDELADLMLVASKEVEESICRVAQMGRAAGIHLVIATQRPSADVITGLMKANIPSRIALAVSSAMESRIIMDTMGAEKLVGNGDMLYKPVGANKPTRIQGTFVSDAERESVIEFLKESGAPDYDDTVGNYIENAASDDKKVGGAGQDSSNDNDYDEMFGDAANVVMDLGQASVSVLQRKLKLGYSRAARLMDQLEEAGVVGPFEGSKPRQVLVTRAQWQEMQSGGGVPAATDDAYADIPKDDFTDLAPEPDEESEA
ncbi:MAG: DNA translocase FtsK [Oscillospiraceae bacterium]|nr:DNA translocase FtsK [Oscillospiraceae bacterium]